VACLTASAVAAYLLLLGRTRAGDSPWALLPLTAVVAPVILLGAAVAALVLSTLLSALVEDPIGELRGPRSEPPTPTEGTGPVPAPEGTSPVPAPEGTSAETTSERTVPAAGSPSASPGASPSASPGASPSASASASASP
jgi:hypothetical protein